MKHEHVHTHFLNTINLPFFICTLRINITASDSFLHSRVYLYLKEKQPDQSQHSTVSDAILV